MADRVETFAVSCTGGLVTNQPTLAQATQMPGTARELINFEPSVEGGYRRINGYIKYSTVPIPALPPAYTQQAYSPGATSMSISGWNEDAGTAYSSGATFKIEGDATTYTITSFASAGAFSGTHGTLNFTPALAASAAARAKIEFTATATSNFDTYPVVTEGDISFLAVLGKNHNQYRFQHNSGYIPLVFSNGSWGSGTSAGNVARVNGGGQTGSTLAMKNLVIAPRAGDTFWIGTTASPIPEMFVVTSGTYTLSSTNTCTVNIYPSLPTSPADGAFIVWVRRYTARIDAASSFVKYKNGIAVATNGGEPFILNGLTSYRPVSKLYDITEVSYDLIRFVEYYKDHMFWGADDKLYFSAPFDEYDYSTASGAGVIEIRGITGLKALRDSLIVFCRDSIFRIVGSDQGTFRKEPVTENIGCLDGRSIQEINGDILFLSSTGFSRLSDTDQQSGLGISVISNAIRTEVNNLLDTTNLSNVYYPSYFDPAKGQYRVFKDILSQPLGYAGTGIIHAQISANPAEVHWSSINGIKVSEVFYDSIAKIIPFTARQSSTPSARYIYLMERGNTFDGTPITATYSTPYYHMNDPRMRKAFLNLETTVEPEGAVTITVDTILNYNKSDVIQPSAVVIGTTGTTYGDNTSPSYVTPLVGNGDVVSLKFTSNTNIPPYVIQSFTVEYSTNDRR